MPDIPVDSWTTTTLGSVVRLQAGSGFKKVFQGRRSGDVPFIKQSDMSLSANSRRIIESNNWVSEAEVKKLSAHPLPQGTTVFGKIGEGLKRNRYRQLVRPTIVDNNMMGAIPTESIDADFLYFFMHTVDLGALSEGSALPYLRTSDVAGISMHLPPLPDQRAIAKVLGVLDDKIESNKRFALLVDELLKAEVEHATDIDSEARTCTFGDLVDRINVGVNPDNLEKAVPYIGLEHMPKGSIILDEWGHSEGLGSGKALFNEGDILFGKLRPYFKKVGVAPLNGVCSTDILVLRPCVETPLSIALAIAASDKLIDYASAASTGTRMPRVSWEYLAEFETEVPGPSMTSALSDRLDPLLALGTELTTQNRTLAAMRDALLPELLSGRIRTPVASELVGAL